MQSYRFIQTLLIGILTFILPAIACQLSSGMEIAQEEQTATSIATTEKRAIAVAQPTTVVMPIANATPTVQPESNITSRTMPTTRPISSVAPRTVPTTQPTSSATPRPTSTPKPTASPTSTPTPRPSPTRTATTQVGCSSLATPVAQPSGIVTSVTLAQGVDSNGAPMYPTTTFSRNSTVHAVVALQSQGVPAQTRIKAVWFATDVGNAAPCNTQISSPIEMSTADLIQPYIDFTQGPITPIGAYRVEIYVNGVLDRFVSFGVR